MARIFVSYSWADRQFINEFVPLLRRVYGQDILWFDEHIHGGEDWWALILRQIGDCDLFVYLISNDSLGSPYCNAELREALRLHKPVLPVVVRPKTQYPGSAPADLQAVLHRTQYVDLAQGFRDPAPLAQLYASVNAILEQAPTRASAPLTPTPVAEPSVADRSHASETPGGRPSWRIVAAAVAVIAIIVIVVVLIASQDGGGKNGDHTAVDVTDTPTGTPSTTAIPAVVTVSSETPVVQKPAITWMPTLSATEVEQTVQARLTATAFSDAQTLSANQTGTSAAQTAAAAWTLTPTPTFTPNPPAPDTPTFTPSPTSSPAPDQLVELRFILSLPSGQNSQGNIAFWVKTGSTQDTKVWRGEADGNHLFPILGQGNLEMYIFDVSSVVLPDGDGLYEDDFADPSHVCVESTSEEAWRPSAVVVIGKTWEGKNYILNAKLDWPENGWLSSGNVVGINDLHRRDLNGNACFPG